MLNGDFNLVVIWVLLMLLDVNRVFITSNGYVGVGGRLVGF